MQTTTPSVSADRNVAPLSGILMYENREAYARALNLYAHLAIEVAREIPLHFSWWAFATLRDRANAAVISNAVAEADLVIIAAQPGTDWPVEFKRWVDSWTLPAAKRLSALGALFAPTHLEFAGVCGRQTYLQHGAARWQLDFLTATSEPTGELMKNKLGLVAATTMDFETEPMNVTDRPAYSPYCGING
jgi:hypothetical protein